MGLPSRQVDWVLLAPPEVNVGDVICAAAGGLPAYRVIALTDGRAWLRGLEDGGDRVAPLVGFHWKAL